MAEKSLLIGDEAADLLLDYAALLAQIGRGDSVRVRAIGVDGNEVTVGFLLNSGTVMLVETSNSALPEPDNVEVIGYLRQRLESYESGERGHQPLEQPEVAEDAPGAGPADEAGA